MFVALASLGACGDDSGGGDDGSPDAEVDAWPEGPNVAVAFAPGATYLRYRDGGGPWREPTPLGDDEYELRVTTYYQLVVACEESFGFEVALTATTFAEDDALWASCGRGASPTPSTVEVTGEMIQPGTIWMGGLALSTTGPWDFTIDVEPGVYDLIAATDDGILIRRAQAITTATAVETVDVDADGAALVGVPLTVIGATASETITSEAVLFTGGGLMFLDGNGATARVPPPSALRRSDAVFLFVTAETATTARSAVTSYTGTETSFTLMPALTGVTFGANRGALAASWDTLPAHTRLEYSASSAAGLEWVDASRGWLSATGATTLGIPTALPGYPAAWRVAPAGPHRRRFVAYDVAGGVSYASEVREDVGASAVRDPDEPGERRRRVERAAEQQARRLLHALGDGRVRVDRVVEVLDRAAALDQQRDALDRR